MYIYQQIDTKKRFKLVVLGIVSDDGHFFVAGGKGLTDIMTYCVDLE